MADLQNQQCVIQLVLCRNRPFPTGADTAVEQVGDFALSIVPYSREPCKSSTTLQDFDIQPNPVCHVKYFAGRIYYPTLYHDTIPAASSTLGIQTAASYWQTQPQMLKVTNECRMYQSAVSWRTKHPNRTSLLKRPPWTTHSSWKRYKPLALLPHPNQHL